MSGVLQDEMGNQESGLADIPVYYKAGMGVSLYQPPEHVLRNRKSHTARLACDDHQAVKGHIGPDKASVRDSQRLLGGDDGYGVSVQGQRSGQAQPRDISQLRIAIDESGFVEDELGDGNGDLLSNSLKGNFSPTSLCEKNFRFNDENVSNHLLGCGRHDYSAKSVNSESSDLLGVVPHLGASSVLLTPPSEDELTSSNQPRCHQHSHQSTKSDVSDIHSEVIEAEGTDEEREQLSPLPYDKPAHKSPERNLCPRKLKLKLNEIASHSNSNNSSLHTSSESLSQGHRRTGSGSDRNSISGISSPELELLNSEASDYPVVYASQFNTIESEIHVVEDEFETISKEIHALTNKYSKQDRDPGSEILKEIFLRYPSIRVRQCERGIHFESVDSDPSQESFSTSESRSRSCSRNRSESRTTSELGDGSVDLSWDLESMLDVVYSEGSDPAPLPSANCSVPGGGERGISCTSLNSSSVNCSVDLGGSLYEDEFHLHLGTLYSLY